MERGSTKQRAAAMQFRGEWWSFQTAVFRAFDRDIATGEAATSIIAPPGSGKTLMGFELIRRLEQPALVLAPNTAIQAQWVEESEQFGPDIAAIDGEPHVLVLTYQSLCRFDTESDAIERLVDRRLDEEKVTGSSERDAQRSRVRQRVRRDLGREDAAALAELLDPSVRERLRQLASHGGITLVCDECHHAASMWGYVIEALLSVVECSHRVGLTATQPSRLTRHEGELYQRLFGDVDIDVHTPSIVREGHLAPYQELAWFVRPLDAELTWLRARDRVFTELLTDLHADASSPLSLTVWTIELIRDERRWARTLREDPELAIAACRFAASADITLPAETPALAEGLGEPDVADWAELLGAWIASLARRARDQADDTPAAAQIDTSALDDLLQSVQQAMDPLGFRITTRGMRRTRAQADRVVCQSAAKALAAIDVLDRERVIRSADLRAVVLCESEVSSQDADELRSVLDPASGSARHLHASLTTDVRTSSLRACVVTGRGVRVAASDADHICARLAQMDAGLAAVTTTPSDQDGIIELRGPGDVWTPQRWITAMTNLLDDGLVHVLISTRAMLGEGWDAPCVNVIVDCTVGATRTTAVQVRGRSLRIDERRPGKVATNWDIVCVEPGIVGGDRDYRRFADKHEWLLAPCEDGSIERGVSHVHPALHARTPPTVEQIRDINTFARERAAQLDLVRDRWKIGDGYRSVERLSLTVGEPASLALTPDQWNAAIAAIAAADDDALTEAVTRPEQRRLRRRARRVGEYAHRSRLSPIGVLAWSVSWWMIAIGVGDSDLVFGLMLTVGGVLFLGQSYLLRNRARRAALMVTTGLALLTPAFGDLDRDGTQSTVLLVLVVWSVARVALAVWMSWGPKLDPPRLPAELQMNSTAWSAFVRAEQGSVAVPVDLLTLVALRAEVARLATSPEELAGATFDERSGYLRLQLPNASDRLGRSVITLVDRWLGAAASGDAMCRPMSGTSLDADDVLQPHQLKLAIHERSPATVKDGPRFSGLPGTQPLDVDDMFDQLPHTHDAWRTVFGDAFTPAIRSSASDLLYLKGGRWRVRDDAAQDYGLVVVDGPHVKERFIRSVWS